MIREYINIFDGAGASSGHLFTDESDHGPGKRFPFSSIATARTDHKRGAGERPHGSIEMIIRLPKIKLKILELRS